MSEAARPYAKAAYEYAKAHNSVAAWQTFLQNMALVLQEPSLQRVLTDPRITSEQILQLFTEVMGKEKSFNHFIQLLLENDRLSCLPSIAQLFDQFRLQDEAIQRVQVVSAYSLTAEQTTAIQHALEKKWGGQVIVDSEVDSNLLGGAMIRMGDRVIDGSVQGQMRQLVNSLA